jgi:biopolymer transport protein TolR
VSLRRGRHRAELNAEINVVSLIDVMMLLLVIFMITAPMMQGGVDVKLPQGESKALDPKTGVVVTVTQSGDVYLDRTRLSLAELRASFRTLAGDRAKGGVMVRGDGRATIQQLVDVMEVLKASGVESMGIITEQVGTPR